MISKTRIDTRSGFAVGLFLATLVALAVRVPFLGHQSGDYRQYISPWYDHLKAFGPVHAFGTEFSNYTPPYLYLLALAVVLPLPKLVAVKTVSIVFDLALAGSVTWLVWDGSGPRRRLGTYVAVLLAPSILLNSAAWAQCDAFYALFVVSAAVLLCRDRPLWSALSLGVALAIKLQAVFVLPLFALFTLRRRVKPLAWLLLPLPYIAAIVPSWLAGRSLTSLLLIYKNQSDTYQQLSMDSPSFYAWVTGREDFGPYAAGIGIAIVGLAVVACWRVRVPLTNEGTIRCATMFAILVPFVLPRMHERYFFLADVLSIAYAAVNFRRWFVPVLVIGASTLSYLPFLYGHKPVPISWLSLLVLAALAATIVDVFSPAVKSGVRTNPLVELSLQERFGRLPRGPRSMDRLAAFAFVGLICTALYAAIYAVLRLTLPALEANAVALITTMALNFAGNRRWTFRSVGRLGPEVAGYLIAYAIGLAASTSTLALALAALRNPSRPMELGIAIIASATATVVRFALLRRFVYRPARQQRASLGPPLSVTAQGERRR